MEPKTYNSFLPLAQDEKIAEIAFPILKVYAHTGKDRHTFSMVVPFTFSEGNGLLITAVTVFLARPVSVLIALLPIRMSLQEKLFVGWVGLRGAVPIILATFPLLASLSKASFLFDLAFFVVLASVLLQGTTVPFMARRLGVLVPASVARE
jgi:NhaP-type Na+/H+ and K+/H+ antiporter